jgi:hypothetical protein
MIRAVPSTVTRRVEGSSPANPVLPGELRCLPGKGIAGALHLDILRRWPSGSRRQLHPARVQKLSLCPVSKQSRLLHDLSGRTFDGSWPMLVRLVGPVGIPADRSRIGSSRQRRTGWLNPVNPVAYPQVVWLSCGESRRGVVKPMTEVARESFLAAHGRAA